MRKLGPDEMIMERCFFRNSHVAIGNVFGEKEAYEDKSDWLFTSYGNSATVVFTRKKGTDFCTGIAQINSIFF